MKGPKTKPSGIGEILEVQCRRLGLSRRMNEQRLLGAWSEVVGEGVAERTQPVRIENRVLLLKVTNSVWMQQLQFMKELIIKKLHDKTGIDWVKDLRFYIGEVENTARGAKKQLAKRDWPRLNESDLENISRQVSGLQDPEMKKILSELYGRALIVGRDRENNAKGKNS